MAELKRRGFLAGLAGLAAGSVARPSTAAAQAPSQMKLLGYDAVAVPDSELMGLVRDPVCVGEALSVFSLKDTLAKNEKWTDFLAALDIAYAREKNSFVNVPLPYDREVFIKAMVVNNFVTQYYRYDASLHDAECVKENPLNPAGYYKEKVLDASGNAIGSLEISAAGSNANTVTNCVLSPQDVLQNGGGALCLDFAAAIFKGIKHLGVPPQGDIVFAIGEYKADSAALAVPYNQSGEVHAWAAMRSSQSSPWLVISGANTAMPDIVITETGNMPTLGEYYVPVLAMDGKGRVLKVDSLDANQIPKQIATSDAQMFAATQGRLYMFDHGNTVEVSPSIQPPINNTKQAAQSNPASNDTAGIQSGAASAASQPLALRSLSPVQLRTLNPY